MENADYLLLENRMGRDHLADRLLKQADNSAKLLHQGEGIFRLERFVPLDALVGAVLKFSGLGRITRRSFLDVRAVTRKWVLPHLPRAFDGFRLLQLSDLHIDLDPDLAPRIADLISRTPHDAAVVTGDYRNKTDGDYGPCTEAMASITRTLSPNRWGILGNHDCIEMVPSLEAAGLPILLNAHAEIARDDSRLWIAGIDDPHFYKTHNLALARGPAPEDACVILLSHSPETYAEASESGFDLQLSGHTHGGQICLPGGHPVVVPCQVPKPFIRGSWRYGTLQGYTSPGTGACAVPARWNCPPEVTVHVLHSPSQK